jgi:hypothetical protein
VRSPHGARPVVAAVSAAAAAVLLLTGCLRIESGSAPPVVASGGAAGPAAALLGQLAVSQPSSMRGYSRDRFPHWRDTGANCDVRDTVLQRDGERVAPVRVSGCNVVGGRWFSRYDGLTLADPQQVDIDHMVPLANAWRSGAGTWDDKRRGDFANDLTRPQLKAVSRTSNRAKGDQDPAQWRPPDRAYWCQYAQDWIAVKHFWRLTVTTAEKAALGDMMGACR